MFKHKALKTGFATLMVIVLLIFSAGLSENHLKVGTGGENSHNPDSKGFFVTALDESVQHTKGLLNVFFGRFYPSPDEIFLGTPTPGNLLAGRIKVLSSPAYWSNYFYEALVKGVFVIPKPFDVVKPELLLPTADVCAGNNPSPLPLQPVDIGGITYEWNGREKTVRDFVITTETDCLVFVHDGKIIYEDYANGWSPEMRHQPWSVTKSVTSAMVGIARGDGKIESVHDPVEYYIEDLQGTVWEGVTIENLLQMESGIYWNEEVPLLAFNCQVQQWMSLFLDFFTNGLFGLTRNEYFRTLDRVAEPGKVFRYNSADTQVLAWLVETVYDTTFAEAVSEKLWKPAGMEGDAAVLTDRTGSAIASQGFYSRVYDLARFGELYRNGGKTPDGRQIIPAEWIEMSVGFTENSGGSYGYQWWNGSSTLDIFQASGFQGNKVSVCPEASLTGVRLSHHLGANLRPYGDNPASFSTYGFEVDMGSQEWTTMFTAVAEKIISGNIEITGTY